MGCTHLGVHEPLPTPPISSRSGRTVTEISLLQNLYGATLNGDALHARCIAARGLVSHTCLEYGEETHDLASKILVSWKVALSLPTTRTLRKRLATSNFINLMIYSMIARTTASGYLQMYASLLLHTPLFPHSSSQLF